MLPPTQPLRVWLMMATIASGCALGPPQRVGSPGGDAGMPTDSGMNVPDSGRLFDAGSVDAFVPSSDAGRPGFDAGPAPRDAGRLGFDAGFDSGFDAGFDASVDAGFDAAPPPPPPPIHDPVTERIVASAERGWTSGRAGLDVSDRIWLAWRFEVPSGETWDLRAAGFHDRGGEGSFFAAVVPLDSEDGPIDLSMSSALAGPVVGVLDGVRGDIRVDLDAPLTSGWYALVLGSGDHGASAIAPAGPAAGLPGIVGTAAPFTIVRRTGDRFEAGSGFRFFVILGAS